MTSEPHRIFLTPGDRIRAFGGFAISSQSPYEQVAIQIRDSAAEYSDCKSLFFQLDLTMSRSQAQDLIDALKEVLK